VLEGETAHEVTGTGGSFSLIRQDASTFSSSQDTLSVVIEQVTSSETRFIVRDNDAGAGNFVELDWSSFTLTNSETNFGSVDRLNLRRIRGSYNGGELVDVRISYTPETSGNRRQVQFQPDSIDNDGSAYLHHAQLEEAPNVSSPIVTGSSAKTRAGDDYVIPKGDWWNTKEGTFIFEFVPQLFYQPFDSEQFGFIDSNGEPTSYFNIYWADNPAPFEIQVQHNLAGPNRTVAPGTAAAFQKSTFACSFSNSGKLIVSLNGQSNTRQNTKATAPLLEEKDIQTGDASFVRYADISYLPRALPESTLNTLTT